MRRDPFVKENLTCTYDCGGEKHEMTLNPRGQVGFSHHTVDELMSELTLQALIGASEEEEPNTCVQVFKALTHPSNHFASFMRAKRSLYYAIADYIERARNLRMQRAEKIVGVDWLKMPVAQRWEERAKLEVHKAYKKFCYYGRDFPWDWVFCSADDEIPFNPVRYLSTYQTYGHVVKCNQWRILFLGLCDLQPHDKVRMRKGWDAVALLLRPGRGKDVYKSRAIIRREDSDGKWWAVRKWLKEEDAKDQHRHALRRKYLELGGKNV